MAEGQQIKLPVVAWEDVVLDVTTLYVPLTWVVRLFGCRRESVWYHVNRGHLGACVVGGEVWLSFDRRKLQDSRPVDLKTLVRSTVFCGDVAQSGSRTLRGSIAV
jgi:hypothetical protein